MVGVRLKSELCFCVADPQHKGVSYADHVLKLDLNQRSRAAFTTYIYIYSQSLWI